MKKPFKSIGLFTKNHSTAVTDTLLKVIEHCNQNGIKVWIEKTSAACLKLDPELIKSARELGKLCELFVVVGGDGSLLHAARLAVSANLPIIGINRGQLGFLADIKPLDLTEKLGEILNGHYLIEQRFLLETRIKTGAKTKEQSKALNEAVISLGDRASMIEFEIYIDEVFMCSQRSDGMIIATPTGSTAYALSGGGPILQPELNACVLIPMFPHTLSSRPIVIPGDKKITIKLAEKTQHCARLSCDGEPYLTIEPGETVSIKKLARKLKLIHPLDYNYYENLRSKLHWGRKFMQ